MGYSRNTEFITSEGIKSFLDFDDGDEVRVLNHEGNYVDAVVTFLGRKPATLVIFENGIRIVASNDVRWIGLDETRNHQHVHILPSVDRNPRAIEFKIKERKVSKEEFCWTFEVEGDSFVTPEGICLSTN